MKVVALDLETSGLSSQYDQILQIGAVVMDDGEIVGTPFYERIRPFEKFKVSLEAAGAQIGSPEDPDFGTNLGAWLSGLMAAPTSRDVFIKMLEWSESLGLESVPVVAHNAGFDKGFFSQWRNLYRVATAGSPVLGPTWICTMELAMTKRAELGIKKFGLDVVAAALGLPARSDAHDALQDAILCGQAYYQLIKTGCEHK